MAKSTVGWGVARANRASATPKRAARSALRFHRIAGPRDIAARLGGDELVMLLTAPTSARDAERMAERLLEACAAPVAIAGESVTPLCSIGIALCPHHAGDLAGLLNCADRALYDAKKAGRGRYRMHA